MGTFILIVVAVSAVVFALIIWGAAQLNKASNVPEVDEDYGARLQKYRDATNDFVVFELEDPDAHRVKVEGKHGVVSAKEGEAGVRVVQFSSDVDNFHLTMDRTIAFADIRMVEVVQNDKIETYRRNVTTPVAVAKNKSALGRGLVGGALIGPAGLVLGAASALTSETQIVEHKSSELAERTVKGPPILIITTRDRHDAFVKAEFVDVDVARSFALWLGDQLPEAT